MRSNGQWLAALALVAGTIGCGSNGSLTAPSAQSSGSLVLSGRVVETVSQLEQPSVGARVEVIGEGYVRSTLTDADGRYAVDGLAAGAVQVVVHKPGYESETTSIELVRSQQMDFRIVEARRRDVQHGPRES